MAYGRGFRGGYGSGRSMRRGFGRGIGFYPPAVFDYPDHVSLLKQEAVTLKNRLETINKRISDLEKTD
jgi:hypothetical protein